MATAVIEHHPENGSASHVVVIRGKRGGEAVTIWFACETADRAEAKRPDLERGFSEAGF